MTRFYKNEFNNDSYGERYRKKQVWNPENEDWYYKDFGGVPYNPQYDDYDHKQFIRRHGFMNSFKNENINRYDDPLEFDYTRRNDNGPVGGNGGAAVEVVRKNRRRRDTIPIERNSIDSVQRSSNSDLFNDIREIDKNTKNVDESQIHVRVRSSSNIKPFVANSRMSDMYVPVKKTVSGNVQINPKYKDKVVIEKVGTTKRKSRVLIDKKKARLAAWNPIIYKKIVEEKKAQNFRQEMLDYIDKKLIEEEKVIDNKVGSLFHNIDRKAKEAMDNYMNDKIDVSRFNDKSASTMLFNSFKPRNVAAGVDNLFNIEYVYKDDAVNSEDHYKQRLVPKFKSDKEHEQYKAWNKYKNQVLGNAELNDVDKSLRLMVYGLNRLNDQIKSVREDTTKEMKRLDIIPELLKTTGLITENDEIGKSAPLIDRISLLESLVNGINEKFANKIDRAEVDNLKTEIEQTLLDPKGKISQRIGGIQNTIERFGESHHFSKKEVDDMMKKAIKSSVDASKQRLQNEMSRRINAIEDKVNKFYNYNLIELPSIRNYSNEMAEVKFDKLSLVALPSRSIKGLYDMIDKYEKNKFVMDSRFNEEVERLEGLRNQDKEALNQIELKYNEFKDLLDVVKKRIDNNEFKVGELNQIVNSIQNKLSKPTVDEFNQFIDMLDKYMSEKTDNRFDFDKALTVLNQYAVNNDFNAVTNDDFVFAKNRLLATPLGQSLYNSFEKDNNMYFDRFVRKSLNDGYYNAFIYMNDKLNEAADESVKKVVGLLFNDNGQPINVLTDDVKKSMLNVGRGYLTAVNSINNLLLNVNNNRKMVNSLENEIKLLNERYDAINQRINAIGDSFNVDLKEITKLEQSKEKIKSLIDSVKRTSDLLQNGDPYKGLRSVKVLNDNLDRLNKLYDFFVKYPAEIADEDMREIQNGFDKMKNELVPVAKPFSIEISDGEILDDDRKWLESFFRQVAAPNSKFAKAMAKVVGSTVKYGIEFMDPDYNMYQQARKEIEDDMKNRPQYYLTDNVGTGVKKFMFENLYKTILSEKNNYLSPYVLDNVYDKFDEKSKRGALTVGLTNKYIKNVVLDTISKLPNNKVLLDHVNSLPIFVDVPLSINNIAGSKLVFNNARYPDRVGVSDAVSRRGYKYQPLYDSVINLWKSDPYTLARSDQDKLSQLFDNVLNETRRYTYNYAIPMLAHDYGNLNNLIMNNELVQSYYRNIGNDFVNKPELGWIEMWDKDLKVPVPIKVGDESRLLIGDKEFSVNEENGQLVPVVKRNNRINMRIEDLNERDYMTYTFVDDDEKKRWEDFNNWWDYKSKHAEDSFYSDEVKGNDFRKFVKIYDDNHGYENGQYSKKPASLHFKLNNVKPGTTVEAYDGEGSLIDKEGNKRSFTGKAVRINVPNEKPFYGFNEESYKEDMFDRNQSYRDKRRRVITQIREIED